MVRLTNYSTSSNRIASGSSLVKHDCSYLVIFYFFKPASAFFRKNRELNARSFDHPVATWFRLKPVGVSTTGTVRAVCPPDGVRPPLYFSFILKIEVHPLQASKTQLKEFSRYKTWQTLITSYYPTLCTCKKVKIELLVLPIAKSLVHFLSIFLASLILVVLVGQY